jgi:broad specificity phosphatase PhoE
LELILVRHAEPVRHQVAAGSADPGLHERGRVQAEALARWLSREHIEAVVHSPARRAVETARPLAEALQLTAVPLDGIAEFDRGAPEYVPVEELKAADDPRWQALARGELFGDGVDPTAFRRRVVATLEGVVRANPGGRVVAVCHGGVINAYVGHVLGITRPLWFAPAYAGISRIAASRSGQRSVLSLNETAHLKPVFPASSDRSP